MFNLEIGDVVKVVVKADYGDFTSQIIGEVTEVEDNGFWVTEDKKTDEFVMFHEVRSLQVIA